MDHYGREGLREYLTQFALAFHIPLLENIKRQGLQAVADYLRWLYDTEEAPDALELTQTEDCLAVTVRYCPAVRYMRSRGHTPAESYGSCTAAVYEALAEESGLSFTMKDYCHETGAASYVFAR